MEEFGDKNSRDKATNNGSSRLQSRKTPQKRLLSTYVETIREGFKKIGGCQDIEQEEVMKPKKSTNQDLHRDHHGLSGERNQTSHRKSKSRKRQYSTDSQLCGFDDYHSCVPKLDSMDRTLFWLHNTDLRTDSEISLSGLPMRGTLLPDHYTVDHEYPYCYCHDGDDGAATSVSGCESARGTHGRGTPPLLDPKMPRLDELFQQLQQKQEREARHQIIAAGEQHLLSFNLLDVYSHQVAGMPIGTTPEILPYMAPPTHKKRTTTMKTDFKKYCEFPPLPVDVLNKLQHLCKWEACSRQFDSVEDLFTHVDQCHIQAYKILGTKHYRITCKWNNCNQTFYARYKLLLHVHSQHIYHPQPVQVHSLRKKDETKKGGGRRDDFQWQLTSSSKRMKRFRIRNKAHQHKSRGF